MRQMHGERQGLNNNSGETSDWRGGGGGLMFLALFFPLGPFFQTMLDLINPTFLLMKLVCLHND